MCAVVTLTQPQTYICSAPPVVIDARTWLLQMRGQHDLIMEKHVSKPEKLYWVCPFHLTAIIRSTNMIEWLKLTSGRTRSNVITLFQRTESFMSAFWCVLLNEFKGYMRGMALEDAWGQWGPEKEKLCWDGVQALPATEIREERRGQAGAASENSREDNKAEGVSCKCPLRRSSPPSTIIDLLQTIYRIKAWSPYWVNLL